MIVQHRRSTLPVHLVSITGMAAIDSSAPETTSSDNSPTLVRRSWGKHQGPGSDSGSSGKSSDSLGSSSSGGKAAAVKLRDNERYVGMWRKFGSSERDMAPFCCQEFVFDTSCS